MEQKFQIVIVGGGNAGLSTASKLLKKRPKLSIAIIDHSDKHYYQPAWTLVGAGVYDINKTLRSEADFIPKNAVWIKEAVVSFRPNQNQVVCSNGAIIHYEVLIVCPGIQIDWDKIKGLPETLGNNDVSSNYSFDTAPYTWELIKKFKGGTAVFTNPTTPIKCGGAPQKIMYLAADYWRKQGILDKCKIYYLSGAGVIFGVKEYAATLEKVLEKGNIITHFGVNVNAIDGTTKTIFYQEKNAEGKLIEKSLNFDMAHVVPPQSAPEFIKNSPLSDKNNPLGYVAVNKHTLQQIDYPNIFALGDCMNAPCSKTGAAIRKQAPVVAVNVIAFMNGKPLPAVYNGYSACPIPTEYGKLMLAEFDYTNTPRMSFPFDQAKPRWSMWLLKTKVLPWLYWNRILNGKA